MSCCLSMGFRYCWGCVLLLSLTDSGSSGSENKLMPFTVSFSKKSTPYNISNLRIILSPRMVRGIKLCYWQKIMQRRGNDFQEFHKKSFQIISEVSAVIKLNSYISLLRSAQRYQQELKLKIRFTAES